MKGNDVVHHPLRLPLLALAALAISLAGAGGLGAQPLARTDGSVGFTENRGQWSGPGRYLARYQGLDLWVTDNALRYDFHRVDGGARRGHVVEVGVMLGTGQARGLRPMAERRSFVGGDRSAWRLDVPIYRDVAIRELAAGVDLVVYDDGGHPRHDLHVAPGIDPSMITLVYSGAEKLSVASDGALRLSTSIGDVEQRGLVAYQVVDGRRRTVECAFELRGANGVGFRVGRYDRSRPLVIDPVTFSSFIGGANDDIVNGVAVDSSGNVHVVGETSSANFPYVTGSYFATLQGTSDAFVAQLAPDAQSYVSSTFIGGAGADAALDIAVDRFGNAYVVGRTESADFPARRGFDSTYNGATDAFVLRLDSLGRTLTFSTLIGGSASESATAVAIDAAGRIFVAGHTLSSSFPTTTAAYQTSSTGQEGWALKLSADGRTLLYSTFIGGDANEEVTDLALRNGIAYVAGITNSDGTSGDAFPTTTGAAQPSFGGATDGFIVAVDTTGRSVLYATLLGSGGVDEIRGIAVDDQGAAYATGRTTSTSFPTTIGAIQSVLQGTDDAFLVKLGATGSSVLFSTLIGGAGTETGVALATVPGGRTFIAGHTTSASFPTVAGAMQTRFAGGRDLFVAELADLGNKLVYGSFVGGTGDDSLTSMVLLDGATLYLGGASRSIDYPATTGAVGPQIAGGLDGIITRFDVLQVLGPNGGNVLCAGQEHTLRWTGGNTVNYDIALSANNGVTWTPIALSVSSNEFRWLVPPQLPAGNQYRIRIAAAGGAEYDASDTSFTILAPPSILSHPTGVSRPEGATATFTVNGTGSAPIGIVWQRSDDSGATWSDIPNATTNQFTTAALRAADDSAMFRALFINACDTVETRTATLVVQAIDVQTPVGGEVFCIGSTQSITFARQHVSAVNVELSTNGGVNWSAIATNVSGSSFQWTIPSTVRAGSSFRIRVVDANGQAQDTSTGLFAIHSPATVVASPENALTPVGTNASFTVAGEGFPGFTIQWQTRASPSEPWVDLPNGNVGTILVSNVTQEQNGSQVRAIISNPCGADTSDVATLNVGTSGVETPAEAGIALAVTPNPARDEARVTLGARRASDARVVLVDARGAVVRELLAGRIDAGTTSITVETASLAPGAYRVVLVIDGIASSQPIIVVR